MIQFIIRPLQTATGAVRYTAQVKSVGTLDLDGILDSMLERDPIGGRPAAKAVLDSFFAVCQARTLEGYNLKTPFFNSRVSVRGGFDGPTDGFVAGRNTVSFTASPGLDLARALENAHVEKLEASQRQANMLAIYDVDSALTNQLTRGGMASLKGKRLKIGTSAGEGLFLVRADGTEVPITKFATNTPSELVFQVPTAGLTAGEQMRLVIRNVMTGTRELRTSAVGQLLTIM